MSRAASTNLPEFGAHMKRLADSVGIELEEVMLWQMALMGKDLIKMTGGFPGTSLGAQHKRQKDNVRTDLEDIFQPVEQAALDVWGDRLKAGGGDKITQDMNGSAVDIHKNQLSRDPMNFWHLGHRKRVTGRTVMHKGEAKYAWGGKRFVTKQQLEKYIKEIQKRVGKLKSGWLQSAMEFASKSKAFATNMAPEWVMRHAGTTPGAPATMRYNKADLTGEWSVSNNVKYGRKFNSVISAAIRTRYNDLTKGYAFTRIQGILKKQNDNIREAG